MEAPTAEQVKSAGRHPAVGWIAAPLILSIVYGLYDWNTTDNEVKPRLAVIEEVLLEQRAINESLDEAVDANLINNAQRTIRVTARITTRLEGKENLTPEERKELLTAKYQNQEAWESLERLDD
jgi:Zn-dependent M32 family carboxypeptidase